MTTLGKWFVPCFVLVLCLGTLVLTPAVARAAAPPEADDAPRWAVDPDTEPGTSPHVWPIVDYRLRSRKRLETTNTETREPRFHAKAPRDGWDPSWRVGARAYFYEWSDERLNLVGHGTIKKVRMRRDHVRVEASIDSFLYARPVVRNLTIDRRPTPVTRQMLVDRRRPWNQRWFMSFAMQ